MVKAKDQVSYYKMLGVEPGFTEKQLRSAYLKACLENHPDKVAASGMTEQEATEKFQYVQKAYDTLSDPNLLAEYDRYQSEIKTPDTLSTNLVPTQGLRFSGYTTEDRGFYKVYSDVFQRIYENEVSYMNNKNLPKDSVLRPPDMGDESSPIQAVKEFYNYWVEFSTVMQFKWEEPHSDYEIKEAPSTKGVTMMERRNMKARKKARKQYNNKVRWLAGFAKRMDIRVAAAEEKAAEARKKAAEEERERRRRVKKEMREKAAEYVEQEWTKPVERRRSKYDVVEKEEDEKDEWECMLCGKEFKSEMQCRNHEMSRKHRDAMAELVGLKHQNRDLLEDVMELIEEEDDDDEEVLEGDCEDEKMDDDGEVVDHAGDEIWGSVYGKPNEEVGEGEVLEISDEEEEEEDINEMDVLKTMLAMRKSTMENVGYEDILAPIYVEVAVEENKDDGEKEAEVLKPIPRRRRRRSMKISTDGEVDTSGMKEGKSDSSAESTVENGTDDEPKQVKQRDRNLIDCEDKGVEHLVWFKRNGGKSVRRLKKSRRDIARN